MKGIYKITNTVNGKAYIGKCKNFHVRTKEHIRKLKSNKHFNNYLQNAFNKYGEYAFVFEFIEKCDNVNERERYWIEKEKTLFSQKGYNIVSGGQGDNHTEESIRRIKKSKEVYSKSVFGFDSEGFLIKTWDSIKSCSKELGCNTCDVRRTIKELQISCKGYILQDVPIFKKRRFRKDIAKLRKRNSRGMFI